MFRAALYAVLCLLTHGSWVVLYPFGARRLLLFGIMYTAGNITLTFLTLHPRCQVMVKNRWQVDHGVALTFDDGPAAASTPALLRILREKGVVATFFVIGRRAEERPDLVRAILADGHAVANHTYSHSPLFCFLSPRRLGQEIERGQQAIASLTGSRPRYFRSPVGMRHALLNLYLKRAGLEYISWRVRAYDTRVQKPEVIRRRISGRAAAGDIILLHDNGSPGAAAMLDVLPTLIDDLRNRGFDFVRV